MEDLGKYLKEFRESQGLEYINVYSDIRLREEQVRMMEENRFFELGPYGVVKAMVYNYARYLGADLDAVMKEFGVLVPEATKSHNSPSSPRKQKKILLSTNFLWSIGIFIFVLILGSILFHAWKQGWLKAPQILKSEIPDSLALDQNKKEEPQQFAPDSTRMHMLKLSKELNSSSTQNNKNTDKTTGKTDNTDYINRFMGDSPVNRE